VSPLRLFRFSSAASVTCGHILEQLHRVLVAGPFLENVDGRDFLAVFPLVNVDAGTELFELERCHLELELGHLLQRKLVQAGAWPPLSSPEAWRLPLAGRLWIQARR